LYVTQQRTIGAFGVIEVALVVVIDGADVGPQQELAENSFSCVYFRTLERRQNFLGRVEIVVRDTERRCAGWLAQPATEMTP
jgi:hypothetical protein